MENDNKEQDHKDFDPYGYGEPQNQPQSETQNGESSGYTYGNTDENKTQYGYDENQNAYQTYGQQYGNGSGYNSGYGQNNSYSNNEDGMDTSPLSMGEWALTILALMIPCCGGIILYIYWAFSKKGNLNRRNFCRAALIIQLVLAVIYIIVLLIFGGSLFSIIKSANYTYYY